MVDRWIGLSTSDNFQLSTANGGSELPTYDDQLIANEFVPTTAHLMARSAGQDQCRASASSKNRSVAAEAGCGFAWSADVVTLCDAGVKPF